MIRGPVGLLWIRTASYVMMSSPLLKKTRRCSKNWATYITTVLQVRSMILRRITIHLRALWVDMTWKACSAEWETKPITLKIMFWSMVILIRRRAPAIIKAITWPINRQHQQSCFLNLETRRMSNSSCHRTFQWATTTIPQWLSSHFLTLSPSKIQFHHVDMASKRHQATIQ